MRCDVLLAALTYGGCVANLGEIIPNDALFYEWCSLGDFLAHHGAL